MGRAGWVAIISLLVLVVDFLTLENRLVTVNPALQAIGGLIGVLALGGLVWALVLAVARRAKGARSGGTAAGRAVRPPLPRTPPKKARFRSIKVLAGLAILASFMVVLPVLVHRNLIVPSSDYVPGPWVAEAFLSLFAVGVQLFAPTPMALVFWPSTAIGVYFLISHRDRPVLDALLGIAAAGLVFGLFRFIAPR